MAKKPKDITLYPPKIESTSRLFPGVVIKQALTEQFEEPFDAYVTAVGRVAHAWNHMQEELAKLFTLVLDTNDSAALAVWYSQPGDRLQHGMLTAAITETPESRWSRKFPRAKSDLLWVVNKARELGQFRNVVIHAPCSVELTDDGFTISASSFQGHPLAKKLVEKDILQEFDVCERYAKVLANFAHGLWFHLAGFGDVMDKPVPWPERPSKPDLKPRKKARIPKDGGPSK